MTDSLYVKTAGGIFPIAIEGTGGSGGSTIARLVSRNREAVIPAGTAFAVPTYTLGGNSLTVNYNGLMLALGKDYIEESTTSVKFAFDIAVDDVIVATAYGASATDTRSMQVSASRTETIATGTSYQVPTYSLGRHSVQVYLDGLQYTDFTEVDTTHIAFDIDISPTTEIVVVVG